jgi:hypothetical protein
MLLLLLAVTIPKAAAGGGGGGWPLDPTDYRRDVVELASAVRARRHLGSVEAARLHPAAHERRDARAIARAPVLWCAPTPPHTETVTERGRKSQQAIVADTTT